MKLTEEDYNEEGLQDLLAEHGPAYDINVQVFRHLQRTITGWPAGKPAELKQPGDVSRPHDDIFPKRVLIFSPHPDDDVISMGGTLIRLAKQAMKFMLPIRPLAISRYLMMTRFGFAIS